MTKIFLVILLIIGLILGVYLVTQKTNISPKASADLTPTQVKISNISDNSFTVSWLTTAPVIGFISYGKDSKLGDAQIDDRDSSSGVARITHHVSLKLLTPQTKYFFKIGSGSEIYDDNGKQYFQTTAPTTQNTPPLAVSVFGKISNTDNSIPKEALVYLIASDSSTLSSYLRDDGNFLLTVNNARKKDLSDYIAVKEGDLLNLTVLTSIDSKMELSTNLDTKTPVQITIGSNSALPIESPIESNPKPAQVSKETTTSNPVWDSIKHFLHL